MSLLSFDVVSSLSGLYVQEGLGYPIDEVGAYRTKDSRRWFFLYGVGAETLW